jgi:rhodanese-related sulfurtransferase
VKEVRRTLLEFLIIVVAGLGIGLAANALSPHRLSLTHNFFPALGPLSSRPTNARTHPDSGPTSRTSSGPTSAPAAEREAVIAQIKQLGFQVLEYDDMNALYEDPLYRVGVYAIVDARSKESYQDGHIPGAYHLDRFEPEKDMPKVLEACKTAEKVVVYCHGGDCDESKWTAIDLSMAGVPSFKLTIYIGGITEWQEKGGPIERGDRNSGDIVKGGQQ